MDLVLYRYLLRRLLKYPVTFSRNKNFDSYDSKEGQKAISRAKVLRVLLEEFASKENHIVVDYIEESYHVTVSDEQLHIKNKYILDIFEKDVIMQLIDKSSFDYFNGLNDDKES